LQAASTGQRLGLADNWLRHVTDVADKHSNWLPNVRSEQARADRICELNVLEQVMNVCQTTVLRDAWSRDQACTVHGWVYSLRNGYVNDLGVDVDALERLPSLYAAALARIQLRSNDETR
jgi:carbonic anhydrase